MNSELECAIQAYWEASSNGLRGANIELSVDTLRELQDVSFSNRLARVSLEALNKIASKFLFRRIV